MRCPNQAAITAHATDPAASATSITGPRYARMTSHTTTATAAPAPAVMKTNQPSPAAASSNRGVWAYQTPCGVITTWTLGVIADHNQPSGKPRRVTVAAIARAQTNSRRHRPGVRWGRASWLGSTVQP